MERSNEVLKSTEVSSRSLEVKVAVLEERVAGLRHDMTALDNKLNESVGRIERMIDEIRDRPNSVQEFLENNWKAIVLVVMAFMGTNATVVEIIAKAFFH